MTNSQIYLIAGAIAVLFGLFFFGNTTPPKTERENIPSSAKDFEIDAYINVARSKLNPAAEDILKGLESKQAEEGDPSETVLSEIAGFWKITGSQLLYAHYSAAAAALVNTDSAWGFAGSQFLPAFKEEDPEARQYAISSSERCFTTTQQLAPEKTIWTPGLAQVMMDGQGDVMGGVQLLLGIVKEDPGNIPANLLLGKMSIVSGQYEKAVLRLEKVTGIDTTNLEAFLLLSEAYKGAGDNNKAVKALETCKNLRNDPMFIQMIDEQIKHIKNDS